MIKISDGYPIKKEVLENFEKKIGQKLPNDYKEFMIKNNGGEIEEDLVFDFYDNSSNKNNSSAVNCFFRLYENQNDEENWDDLEEICERMWEEEEISKTIFPFADDAGGNIICMSLNKEDYGTIYFADHELEEKETGYLVMSKIASSFTDFLNCMYLYE